MSEHLSGVHDLHEDAYRLAHGVSKSMIDKLAHPKTPAHLRAYLDEPPAPPTPTQIFGSLFHSELLQPEKPKSFIARPEGLDLRTKVGKKWAEANGDKQIITQDQNTAIKRMVENVWNHPAAKRLLSNSDFERSLFATDQNGIVRKGRLDVLTKAGNVLPDVKTCASAAAEDFEKSIVEYRYMVQAAYYLDLCELVGIKKEFFAFICVEKTPPYAVAVYQMDELVVEWGRRLYKRDLTLYQHCLETDTWPGYPPEITKIGVPRWSQKEMEEATA